MENADIQDIKSVVVTNISPSANEKTVSDFFSFCGKIGKLYLKKEEGKETNAAVIQFETESAAKTALLLTNALIVDRPITVTQFVVLAPSQENAPSSQPVDLGTPVDASQITQRDFGNVSDEQRTKTSVVASLLAAGYVLSNDAFDQAKEFDDKHGFSRKAQHAVEQIKVKAHEIDVQYGITDKANSVKNSIEEAAKKIDNELHITEKVNSVGQALKLTAQTVKSVVEPAFDNVKANVNNKITQAQENPTVKKGVESVKNTAHKVQQSVNNTINDVKTQTSKVIEEKQKEKRERSPSGSVPAEETEHVPVPTSDETIPPPAYQSDPVPQ